MPYSHLPHFLIALRTLNRKLKIAISTGTIPEFLNLQGVWLNDLVKQLSKADKDWKEAVEKEELFLIQFAFYWKTKSKGMGEEEFSRMIQGIHNKFQAAQAIAVVQSNPAPASSAAKRPIPSPHQALPATPVDEPSPTSDKPATSAAGLLGAGGSAPIIAGPSNLQPQRPAYFNRDEELARHLQAAFEMNDGQPTFQELDQSDAVMDEGDDGSESDVPVGKGKGKSKKGKKKASDVKGKRPPVHVPTDTQAPVQAPKPRPLPVRTGELFPYPCDVCVKRHLKCEKIVGGDNCYTCRRGKIGCSHLVTGNRRRVKGRQVVHDSEQEMAPAIQQPTPAPRPVPPPPRPPTHPLLTPSGPNVSPPRPAARKASKRTLITSGVEDESDESGPAAAIAPARKKRRAAMRADIINAETGRLVQAVEQMDKTNTKRKVAGKRRGKPREEAELKDIVDNYVQRVERIEDANQKFSNLTQSLVETLGERTNELQQRSEMLQSAALTLIKLAEERLTQQASVQRRQNVIFESIMTLITQGLPAVPEVGKKGMGVEDIRSHWKKIMDEQTKLVEESMVGHRQIMGLLHMDSEHLDNLRDSAGRFLPEDVRRLDVQAMLAKARGMGDESEQEGTSMDISDHESDDIRRIRAIKLEQVDDILDLTGDIDVPAPVVGQTFILDDVEPAAEGAPSGRSQEHQHPSSAAGSAAVSSTADIPHSAPIVNLVAATPVNSQDTAAGTITTLHVPPASSPPSPQWRLLLPAPLQQLQAPVTASITRGTLSPPSGLLPPAPPQQLQLPATTSTSRPTSSPPSPSLPPAPPQHLQLPATTSTLPPSPSLLPAPPQQLQLLATTSANRGISSPPSPLLSLVLPQQLQAPATPSASRDRSAEPPQQRGRSRTPLPPTNMITRSRSRGI